MWKDEVMLYVEAIRTYVSGIVDLFYDSDDAVLADTEIQKWIEEVVKIGLSGLPQFGLAHILNTKQQLVSVCSTLIFQGRFSVQYSQGHFLHLQMSKIMQKGSMQKTGL